MRAISKNVGLLAGAATLALGMMAAAPQQAEAAFVLQPGPYSGNDCAGVFNPPNANGFSNCVAPNGSPVIIKFNANGSVSDINAGFPSVTGAEFTFVLGTEGKTGSWSYNPGTDDPAITAFVIKAGSGFDYYVGTGNSGSWTSTPGGAGLSHITFYDTDDGTGSDVTVPAPASLAVFGVALLGLGLVRRRRRAA